MNHDKMLTWNMLIWHVRPACNVVRAPISTSAWEYMKSHIVHALWKQSAKTIMFSLSVFLFIYIYLLYITLDYMLKIKEKGIEKWKATKTTTKSKTDQTQIISCIFFQIFIIFISRPMARYTYGKEIDANLILYSLDKISHLIKAK